MNSSTFLRRLIVFTVIIFLSSLVLLGICIADLHTRSLGYSDAAPIVYVQDTDLGKAINILDSQIELSDGFLYDINFLCGVYKQAAPWEIKISSALLKITGKTTARFLQ